MKTATYSGHRSAVAGVLAAGGVAVAIASWANGRHGLAVALLAIYAVAAAVAFVWAGGGGDVAAVIRAGGDERQRDIGRDAIAITGFVMVVTALVGVVVVTARNGDPGSYGVMSLIGGIAYAVSLFVLHKTR